MRRTIRRGLGKDRHGAPDFIDHHESHAASAFFPSPFEEAAILTLDGVGEWSTATCGVGEGNRIRLTTTSHFPHSLGLLYSAFTYYCGFKVNSGEYKLMGLAPYGRPIYQDLILEQLIDLKPDGSFWLNMDYFNYCQGLTMTNRRFHRLFGGPPRHAGDAAGATAHGPGGQHPGRDRGGHAPDRPRTCSSRPGCEQLVLAGGVALNCVANGRLLREGPFDDIWIQPAAGDAGGALGAALFVWHQLLEKPRQPERPRRPEGELSRPAASRPSRSTHFLSRARHIRPAIRRRSRPARACRRPSRRRQGRRLVPGPDGVRPAMRWERAASWAIPARRRCRRP